MADLLESDEWKKATEYKISDDDIERQRQLIGYMEPAKARDYIQTVTEDNIRNWSVGIGDDNPLFCDPAYARGTRWGGVIAPPMMIFSVNSPMKGDPTPDHIRKLRKSLFRGIHEFVSGSRWEWYRPLRPGDTIFNYSGEDSSEVKQSEFAGRSVINIRKHVRINQRAEVVAVNRVLTVLTERGTAKKKGKYSEIKPATYTDDEIAAIDEVYAAEQVRGGTRQDWSGVQIGDTLGTMAKGPLTVTDIICFHAGGYGFTPYAPSVGRLAYKNRQRIAPFYVKNEFGVPDVAQRLHWDPLWAQAIGNPMAYDYGFMRENYLAHFLTDWMGDDGVLVGLHDEIRKFNYVGDTQTITGEVTAKREEGGRKLVDVAVRFVNQRGEETIKATATIALPDADKPATYPDVPQELAEEAIRLMGRHWELSKP
jgi:acyl dehydratase